MNLLNMLGQHVNQLNDYVSSPEQKGKLLGWTPNQVQHMAMGTSMSSDNWLPASNAAIDALTSRPLEGPPLGAHAFDHAKAAMPTVERSIEKAGGWAYPGLRADFDMAMLTKNANTVKQLLPRIPLDYKARFAADIAKLLGGVQ